MSPSFVGDSDELNAASMSVGPVRRPKTMHLFDLAQEQYAIQPRGHKNNIALSSTCDVRFAAEAVFNDTQEGSNSMS